MATTNNNLSVLPFYDSKKEQDFRIWASYGEAFHLYVSRDFFIPFFLCLPKATGRTITAIRIYEACTDAVIHWDEEYYGTDDTNILGRFNDNGLTMYTMGDYDVIAFFSDREGDGVRLDRGYYYMAVTMSDGKVRYSGAFYAIEDIAMDSLTKIEWTSEKNVEYEGGVIPYEGTHRFVNALYLDAPIGMPGYNFVEEGEERDGYFFAIKQISEKTYKTRFFAPEYICDVMRLIRMADYVTITDKLGRVYNCDSFLMSVDWLEQGHYADVECEFQTDTVVKVIGKSYSSSIGQ